MTNLADTSASIITDRDSAPFIGHPEDVLRHPGMTVAEKREILARWASDAHAIENMPALRQLDDGSIVVIDDILCALRTLDAGGGSSAIDSPGWRASTRKRVTPLFRRLNRGRRSDDDDDPPPCPASAAIPVGFVLADALAA